MSLLTCTLLSGRHTRVRSLRTKSAIIRFSDLSLSDVAKATCSARSASGVAPRGSVPLIGLDSARPERVTERSRSGEHDKTNADVEVDVDVVIAPPLDAAPSGTSMTAPKGAGFALRSCE